MTEMKKQEKEKKAQMAAEEARQAEEKRKKEEEEALAKAQKEAQEKARAAAELKARLEAEWREKARRTLAIFRRAKTEPVVIADEETFQLRHGLVINRIAISSTYHSQIYPVKRERPRLNSGASKPNDSADLKLAVRVTVLDKCFTNYRKHLCETSLKLIKFLGTPESASEVTTKSPTTGLQPATLRHPTLVRIFETFLSDNKVYIFMEELPQGTLSVRIKAGMSVDEVQSVGRQIGNALFFLHGISLAHLNVRSDNFMWDDSKQVKLVGLSRLFQWWDPDLEQKILHKPILDKNYVDHFPSEVAKEGVDFDASVVDVYSLGVLLYLMLVREKFHKTHFKGNEDMKTVWDEVCAIKKDKMKPLSDEVKALLSRIIACKPQERPKLEQLLEDPFFKAGGETANITSVNAEAGSATEPPKSPAQ